MTDPQIIRASNGEELVVLTRAAYDALLAAATAADVSEPDEADDVADLEIARAAKAEWEAAGRPTIPLAVLRRVRAGDSYLKAFRSERGLTQTELASLAGITQGCLSECETSRKAPNAATRDVLARALDIHPVWLTEEAPRGALERSVASAAIEPEADSASRLYKRAVDVVLRERNSSTSFLQRRLSIGYNKAWSLLNRMERDGILGPATVVGPREILRPAPQPGAP